MNIPSGKKIYFASDFHFGIPNKAASMARERRVNAWLDSIRQDAAHIFLVGDLFDVWFEYRNVVPRGYTRFLGKLAELTDAGIIIEVLTGNHDLWMQDYFEEELNISVHHAPIERTYNQARFVIAHGDGLGPGDLKYKMLKKVLRSPVAQWLYRRVHPDTGVGLARWFSVKGDKHGPQSTPAKFLGPEKEWLVQYALTRTETEAIDYFIFGHRHIAIDYTLPNGAHYINLGDWLTYDSYAVFDGKAVELKYFAPAT